MKLITLFQNFTGKVVYIVKRAKAVFTGTLKATEDNPEVLQLKPFNDKYPPLLIHKMQVQQLPLAIVEGTAVASAIEGQAFAADLSQWAINSMQPYGRNVRPLGQLGEACDLPVETLSASLSKGQLNTFFCCKY